MRKYPVTWITTDLAVGYAPRSHNDLDAIRAQGIAAIVNLCAECYDSFFKKWEAMLDFFK